MVDPRLHSRQPKTKLLIWMKKLRTWMLKWKTCRKQVTTFLNKRSSKREKLKKTARSRKCACTTYLSLMTFTTARHAYGCRATRRMAICWPRMRCFKTLWPTMRARPSLLKPIQNYPAISSVFIPATTQQWWRKWSTRLRRMEENLALKIACSSSWNSSPV